MSGRPVTRSAIREKILREHEGESEFSDHILNGNQSADA